MTQSQAHVLLTTPRGAGHSETTTLPALCLRISFAVQCIQPWCCRALQAVALRWVWRVCALEVSLSLQKELQERQSQVGVSPINCEHHRIVLFVHGAGAELIKTHVTTPARRHSRLHSLYWLGF